MKLLEQLEHTLKRKQYSSRTLRAYHGWVERFLRFHKDVAGVWMHPHEMGRQEIEAFLNHLEVNRGVAASATQNRSLQIPRQLEIPAACF